MSNQEILKTFEEFSEAVLRLADKNYDNTIREQREQSCDEVKEIRVAYLRGTKGAVERRRRMDQMDKMQFHPMMPAHFFVGRLDSAEKITLEETEEKLKKEKANQELRKAMEGTIIKPPRKKLTISERAVNYLYGQSKMKGIARFGSRGRKLDYKLMWAVDFLSSELSKQCGFSEAKKSEMVLFKTPFEFFRFVGDIKDGLVPFNDTFVDLQFKASEVRKWLGFTSNEMSLKDVVGLFKGLQEVIFEAEGEPILRDAEKNEWVKTTVSDTLYSLRRDSLGIVSNRWKTKDVVLILRFANIMSWLFIANLSCGKVGRITLPKNARHELDGYGQNILRELRLWKKPRAYNVFDLASVAGLKSKRVDELIGSLKRILTDLKDKSYIKDFEATGKGKNTWFVIVKDEKL
jgi:hypothetical protein